MIFENSYKGKIKIAGVIDEENDENCDTSESD